MKKQTITLKQYTEKLEDKLHRLSQHRITPEGNDHANTICDTLQVIKDYQIKLKREYIISKR